MSALNNTGGRFETTEKTDVFQRVRTSFSRVPDSHAIYLIEGDDSLRKLDRMVENHWLLQWFSTYGGSNGLQKIGKFPLVHGLQDFTIELCVKIALAYELFIKTLNKTQCDQLIW